MSEVEELLRKILDKNHEELRKIYNDVIVFGEGFYFIDSDLNIKHVTTYKVGKEQSNE